MKCKIKLKRDQRRAAQPGGAKAKLASVFDALRAQGFEPGSVAGWNRREIQRNYKILCDSGTIAKNLPLSCVAVEYLAANQPDTVRGSMYLVVSAGWLPDTGDTSYNRIQRLLNRLRENGTIPFAWVVDTVRSTIKPSSWSGLADFTETVRDAYRKNFWASLPDYVEVIVEKDTVAGKVASITREYDVALHPIRGYSSTSYAWSIAQGWKGITKPITIYYLGDHDPSGRDLERNIKQKLTRYSDSGFNWVRLGVNLDQFNTYSIKPLAPKKKDKRFKWFAEQWGTECAEVEAIPAKNLRAMVREAIESHIPAGQWERLQRVEKIEKDTWTRLMANIPVAPDIGDQAAEINEV